VVVEVVVAVVEVVQNKIHALKHVLETVQNASPTKTSLIA